MRLLKLLGRPPFFVNYEATVITVGAGFASSGNTVAKQIAAPTYTNGLGSYSYSWVKLSGSEKISITSSTAERPSFSGTDIADADPQTAVYEVTITDTTTGKIVVDTVDVLAQWTNLT